MRGLRTTCRVLFRFMIINLILFILTGPVVALYGPSGNIKRCVVGAALNLRHPYAITRLLSWKDISSILGNENNLPRTRQALFGFTTSRRNDLLRLLDIKGTRFRGFLLEVSDPTRVKVATAREMREKGDPVSTIALDNNAIAAINAGGFYDPQGTGTGRLPYGVIIHEGRFLIGEDTKQPVDLVGLTRQGILVTGKYTVQEMKKMHVTEGVTFGPPLIVNGRKTITEGDGGWGVAPRTAIGQRKDGTILLLVIDGRQPGYSLGTTLLDVQNILFEQGAYVAANLDGGSSTTMFYNGRVVNMPCDLLGERMVPTAFIVQ